MVEGKKADKNPDDFYARVHQVFSECIPISVSLFRDFAEHTQNMVLFYSDKFYKKLMYRKFR